MSVDIEVRDVPGNHRYEALAGEVVAGFIEYVDHDGERTLRHTEVSDDFAGRGIGGTLARAALDDLRSRGRKVRPVCPSSRAGSPAIPTTCGSWPTRTSTGFADRGGEVACPEGQASAPRHPAL